MSRLILGVCILASVILYNCLHTEKENTANTYSTPYAVTTEIARIANRAAEAGGSINSADLKTISDLVSVSATERLLLDVITGTISLAAKNGTLYFAADPNIIFDKEDHAWGAIRCTLEIRDHPFSRDLVLGMDRKTILVHDVWFITAVKIQTAKE